MTDNSNTNKKVLRKLKKREKRFPWIAIISLVIALTVVSIIVDYFFGESDYLGNILFICLVVTYFIWVIITFLFMMGLEESVNSYLLEHDIDWPSTPDIIAKLLVVLISPSFLFFSIFGIVILVTVIIFSIFDPETYLIYIWLIAETIGIAVICLCYYIDINFKNIIKKLKKLYIHPIILLIIVLLLIVLYIYY